MESVTKDDPAEARSPRSCSRGVDDWTASRPVSDRGAPWFSSTREQQSSFNIFDSNRENVTGELEHKSGELCQDHPFPIPSWAPQIHSFRSSKKGPSLQSGVVIVLLHTSLLAVGNLTQTVFPVRGTSTVAKPAGTMGQRPARSMGRLVVLLCSSKPGEKF